MTMTVEKVHILRQPYTSTPNPVVSDSKVSVRNVNLGERVMCEAVH